MYLFLYTILKKKGYTTACARSQVKDTDNIVQHTGAQTLFQTKGLLWQWKYFLYACPIKHPPKATVSVCFASVSALRGAQTESDRGRAEGERSGGGGGSGGGGERAHRV